MLPASDAKGPAPGSEAARPKAVRIAQEAPEVGSADPASPSKPPSQEVAWRLAALASVPRADAAERDEAVRRQLPEDSEEALDQAKLQAGMGASDVPPRADVAASVSSPNPQEALPLLGGSTKFAFAPASSLSDAEAAAAQAAFWRFHVPHTSEVDKDDLYEIVKYVGYPRISVEEVCQLANEVTPYKEMDLDEVLSFLGRLTKHEYGIFRQVFADLCAEGSAEMHVGRLSDLMRGIGFTPHRTLIREILDSTGPATGLMGFEDVVEFLVAYRRTQGFSSGEVLRLQRAFECFEVRPPPPPPPSAAASSPLKAAREARRQKAEAAAQPGLPLSALVEALTFVFGVHGEIFANRVISNMHGGDGLWAPSQPSHVGLGGERGNAELLGFSEFLVLARRVREVELEDHRAAFDRCRGRSTGRMPTAELQHLMRSLGYEPLWAALNEAMEQVQASHYTSASMKVGVAGCKDLSFEDFFHVRLALEARSGLSESEVDEFSAIFRACGEAGSDLIKVVELDSLLRNMGYTFTPNDLRLLVDRVDVKRTGVLELPDFLRVMGMHREGELKRLRGIFAEHQARSEAGLVIPKDRLFDAIEAATDGYVPRSLRKAVSSPRSKGSSFDDFVYLADAARKAGAESRRRNAGFKEADIRHFHAVFDECDKDQNGLIDSMEIQGLLDTLGIQVRTRAEQKVMMDKLDEARVAARDAAAKGVTPNGGTSFGFWELVQLMRILRKDSDREANELVERTAQELGFSPQEREQFRKIFIKWSRVDAPVDISPGGCPSPGLRRGGSDVGASGDWLEDGLSMETLQRLIRSMGVRIKLREREELERRAAGFGTTDAGLLSFVGFLRMMRWLLDSDFAGINDAAAASAAAQRSKRKASMSPILA